MKFDEMIIETDRLDFPALAVGEGPIILCWHGFPDHPATFGPLAERLVAAGRRVVAPYLRGHHPATADAMRYSDGLTMAADGAAIAESLDPGAAIDMVGHDIGAGIVARVAAAWPERLRRGVTMAVPPPATLRTLFADPEQQKRYFYVWMFQVPGVAEAILTANNALVDYLWSTWSPGLEPGEHLDRVHALYRDPTLSANALRLYRAIFDPTLHDPGLTTLAAKTEVPASIPLLVLAGEQDGCIPPPGFAAARDGLAPGSRVETISDAGHFMHLDQPDVVATMILDWIDR